MGRKSNGEGSITQRQDGRWQASLQVDGRRKTVYGKTRSEVARKLADLQRQATKTGALPNPGRRTLNDLLDAWLEVKAPALKPKTALDYADTCDGYLRPTIGKTPLARLTPDRIERLLTSLRCHPRTAQKVYLRLSQALTMAVRWGWLGANPCERVDAPRYHAERKDLWTAEQLRAFLDGTREHWLGPLWALLAYSGCRLGEALALTWQDVDLATGRMVIAKSVQRIGGTWVTTEPKTQAGMRTITLPHEGVEALQRQAKARLAQGGGGGGLVFANTHGELLAHATVQVAMRRECDRLGLPRVTPHGIRHLHASLLLAGGVAITDVSRRLGHATPGITLSVYSHSIPGRDDGAVQALDNMLGEPARQTRRVR